MQDSCCVCGSENIETVVSDRSSWGKVRLGCQHTRCNDCGFEATSGEQSAYNDKCEVVEICGPFKPIEIGTVHNANAYFDWSWLGCGFGQLSFSKDKETGELTCMNECMGREAVRKLLHAFADHLADNVRLLDER